MSITCRTSISTIFVFFFFNNPAPPNFSTLSLHDALPIWVRRQNVQPYIVQLRAETAAGRLLGPHIYCVGGLVDGADPAWPDRKSTRLNSSHQIISYAVFCLKKKNY